MEQMEEVIAAFVDDERVDAESLSRALATPDGREYLIELLAMRELVAMPIDRAIVEPAPPTSRSRRWVWTAAAAVLLSACTAGAYFAGARFGARSPVQPVETSAPAVAPNTATVVPPAPTTVIRLRPGIDWNERSGGGN